MEKQSVLSPAQRKRCSKSRQALELLSLTEKRQQRIDKLEAKAAELNDLLKSWSADFQPSSAPLTVRENNWVSARLAYTAHLEDGVSVSDYARLIDLRLATNAPNASMVSRWIQACRFIDHVCKNSSNPELKNAETLTNKKGLFRALDRVREFMYLDQEDWVWIAEFYSRHHSQIPAKKRVALTKAIKEAKTNLEYSGEQVDWKCDREEVALRFVDEEPQR